MNVQFIAIILSIILISLLIYSIITQIRENHQRDDPILNELTKKLETIHPIVKNLEFYMGDKSYTINKEKVYICLKDKDNRYYDQNLLTYVILHEVSHAINNEVGHTNKFNDIFQDLLNKATSLGLFNPSIPIPKDYCDY